MTAQDLIDLAKRKNEARRKLLDARMAALQGSTGTDMAKKIFIDSFTCKEQEAYDNLSDEYAIQMMFASK